MRYRKVSYRYDVVVTTAVPRPFGDPWEAARVTLALPAFRPRADVYETADGYQVTVDLAGVDQDQLDIAFYEDAVILAGLRRLPPMPGGGFFRLAEIPQGPLRLEIRFAAMLDPERIAARYECGLLLLSLGKRASVNPEVVP